MRMPALFTGAALAATLALTACGSSTQTSASGTGAAGAPGATAPASASSSSMTHEMTGSETAMLPGAYLPYDAYQKQMAERHDTKVVLFFHATWCPDCKATDTSLTTDGVPAGLTVVKVDYDTMTDLKKKYGITQQHTFVQIDGAGMELAKWTGTRTGAEIKAKTV